MKRVQRIRHIASEANLFVGLDGELTVDLTAYEVRVHDGVTAGGYGLARKDLSNVSAASSVTPGKMTAAQVIFLENSMQKPATWTIGRLTKFDASGYPVDSTVTATEDQLNYLSGVTAGTRTVNKAIVVDGSGFINALGVTTLTATTANLTTANITTFNLGGTAVTATATELNYTDVTTPGVAQELRALVVDASRNIGNLGNITSASGYLSLNASGAGNVYQWIRTNTGATAGVVYWDATADSLQIIKYGADHTTQVNYITMPASGDVTLNGSKLWTAGNDGSGSGLDADLLDGVNSTSFARVDAATNFTTVPTIGGNTIWTSGNDSTLAKCDGTTKYLNTVNYTGANTVIGYNAFISNTTGVNNVVCGFNAFHDNTAGDNSVAIGYNALYTNTTGDNCVAIGAGALFSNTTATGNTAIGTSASYYNLTGTDNTALGLNALYLNTTSYNTAIGALALYTNSTGANNTAVGSKALYSNTTASGTTAVGRFALQANTTGSSNTAVGSSALYANTTGTNNVAVGNDALSVNVSGGTNVAIGVNALDSSTASGNTGCGYNAGSTLVSGSNVSCFGNGAEPSASNVSNEITLGNGSVTTLRCATTTITAISDERDKTNIQKINSGLDLINAVQPVEFVWQMRNLGGVQDEDGDTPEYFGKQGVREAGFIAQQLKSAAATCNAEWVGLVLEENPDRLEAAPGKLLPYIIRAIQELDAKITAMTNLHTQ